ncbi:hypothetical protein R8Z50_08420 [Longispora sp. K20-0274]|uniref:hypothetical protein n=1 Tax=Longispora sp. K20-0274 TaxID=3088255 RepID=UPI00399C04C9
MRCGAVRSGPVRRWGAWRGGVVGRAGVAGCERVAEGRRLTCGRIAAFQLRQGLRNEVQVVVTVLALDPEHDPVAAGAGDASLAGR